MKTKHGLFSRALSILLSVIMIMMTLTAGFILPDTKVTAGAATVGATYTASSVANINTYIANANSAGANVITTIKLGGDITAGETAALTTITGNVLFDFNGHSLTFSYEASGSYGSNNYEYQLPSENQGQNYGGADYLSKAMFNISTSGTMQFVNTATANGTMKVYTYCRSSKSSKITIQTSSNLIYSEGTVIVGDKNNSSYNNFTLFAQAISSHSSDGYSKRNAFANAYTITLNNANSAKLFMYGGTLNACATGRGNHNGENTSRCYPLNVVACYSAEIYGGNISILGNDECGIRNSDSTDTDSCTSFFTAIRCADDNVFIFDVESDVSVYVGSDTSDATVNTANIYSISDATAPYIYGGNFHNSSSRSSSDNGTLNMYAILGAYKLAAGGSITPSTVFATTNTSSALYLYTIFDFSDTFASNGVYPWTYATFRDFVAAHTATSDAHFADSSTHMNDAVNYSGAANKLYTRNGYTHTGWLGATYPTATPSASLTSTGAAGYNATNGGSLFLYPAWTLNTYSISHDINDNTLNPAKLDSGAATSYTILSTTTLGTASRPGYTFAGWKLTAVNYLSNDLTQPWNIGNIYLSTASLTNKVGNISLQAQWTKNPYTATLDMNGGTYNGSTANQVVNYDAETTFAPFTGLTKDYYTFNNTWKVTVVDGNWTINKIYNAGENTELGKYGNITMQAQYTPITYTASYDSNFGSEITDPSALSYNVESTTSLPAASRTGYSLVGWQPVTSVGNWDAGRTYPAGTSFRNMHGNVSFVAVWESSVYKVNLYIAPGESISGNTVLDYAYARTLELNNPSKTGYIFTGWRVKSVSGSENTWGVGTQFPVDTVTGTVTLPANKLGDVTLEAMWTPVVYTVTFNSNGGTPVTAFTYTIEDTVNLPLTTYNGYSFASWTVTSNSGNWNAASYAEGAALTGMYGNVTIKANWTTRVYTVTLVTDGEEVSPNTFNYSITSANSLPAAVKTGYTFKGWKITSAAGSWVNGTVYSDTLPSGFYGNVTLTAQWEHTKYKINLASTGSTAVSEYDYYIDSASFRIPASTLAGYSFLYWQAANTAGNWVKDEKIYSTTDISGKYGNVTLNAVFSANTYSITYKASGSVIKTSQYTIENTISIDSYAKDGYSFSGWKVTSTTGNWRVGNTMPAGELEAHYYYGDVTLEAALSPVSYTATLVPNGGNAVGNIVFNIESTAVLPAPVRTGYDFAGWKVTSETAGAWTKGSVISAGTALTGKFGNVTLTAQWTPTLYTIIYKESDSRNANLVVAPSDINSDWVKQPNGTFVKTAYGLTVTFDPLAETYCINGTCSGQVPAPDFHDNCQFINLFNFTLSGTSADGNYAVTSEYISGSMPAKNPNPDDDSTVATLYFFRGSALKFFSDVAVTPDSKLLTKSCHSDTAEKLTGCLRVYDYFSADRTFNNYTFKLKVETGDTYTGYSQLASTYNIESSCTLATPSNPGYAFRNWTVAADSGSWTAGSNYGAGSVLSNNYGDVEFVASYDPLEYHITYNTDGGDIPADGTYTIVSGFTMPGTDKTAYDFAYWEVQNTVGSWTAGEKIYAGSSLDGKYGNLNVKAVWTPTSYTLTYKDTDGSEYTSLSSSYTTVSATLLAVPSKNGYSFSGWKVDTSLGNWTAGTVLATGSSLNGKYGNVTLTAQWSLNSYTAVYNVNGGESINDKIFTTEMTDVLPLPVRTGFDFAGWKVTSASGSWVNGSMHNAGVSFAGHYGNVTFTAQWTIKTFNVTWVVDGISTVESYDYGTSPSFKGSVAKAADAQYTYTFSSWTPAIQTVSADAVYTAVYTKTVNSYKVTWVVYPDDSSTPVVTEATYNYGDTPLYNNGVNPSRSSSSVEYFWRFAGWSPEITDVTGAVTYTAQYTQVVNPSTVTWVIDGVSNTDHWGAGEIPSYYTTPVKPADGKYEYTFTNWTPAITACTAGGTYTYTAVFSSSPIDYTLTLEAAGGTISGDKTSFVYNYDTASFNLPTASRPGYTFSGWLVTVADGNFSTGVRFGANTAISHRYGNVTLTAQWSPVNYIASAMLYDGLNNTVNYTSESNTVLEIPSRPGYTFVSWTVTVASGNWTVGETVGKTQSFNGKYGDVTLRANFTADKYVLTFDTDGGNAMSAKTYTIESADSLETPVKTGYMFTGWLVTSGDGSWTAGADIADGAALAGKYGNATLTAQWQIRSYTVTWNDLSGSYTDTYVYNTDISARVPSSRGGYQPAWDITVPEKMPANDIVVNAVYTANSYTLNFDANGGVIAGTDILNYTPDNTITLPSVSKTGYTFLGWAPSADTGSWLIADSPYAADDYSGRWGTLTLTAVWMPTEYTITFIPDGGEELAPMTYTLESTSVLPAVSKVGYTFGGWTVVLGDGTWTQGTTVTDGTVLTEKYGNVTLQANWQINTYCISWVCGDEIMYSYVEYGASVLEYTPLTKVGYTGEWDSDVPLVMPANDLQFNAIYTPVSYYARINVNGGTSVDSFYYNTESTAVLASPERAGSTFSGWLVNSSDGNWTKGTVIPGGTALTGKYGNVSLTAQWIIETHTVTWVMGDVSKVTTWYYGAVPSFDGTPVRASDSANSYVFTAWDKEITMVTEDVVYTAIFEATARIYVVTWNIRVSESQSIDVVQEYHYGDTPVYTGDGPFGYSNTDYKYVFSGWSPELTAVIADTVYTAQFTAIEIIKEFSIDNSSVELKPETTGKLTAYANGEEVSEHVLWSSSDTSVATVDGEGKVSAIGHGNCIVKAIYGDGIFISACVITVKSVPVSYITVSAHGVSTTALIGSSVQLYADVLPANATDKTYTWNSDNEYVATVDSNGLVSYLHAGTATISAVSVSGNCKGIITVTVTEKQEDITENTKSYTVMFNSTSNSKFVIDGMKYSSLTVSYPEGSDVVFSLTAGGSITSNGVKLEPDSNGQYVIPAIDRDITIILTDIGIGLDDDDNNEPAQSFMQKLQAFFRSIVQFFRNLFK